LYDRKQSGPFDDTQFFGTRDYGLLSPAGKAQEAFSDAETTVRFAQSTACVDNFVGNLSANTGRPRKIRACNGLLKS
jgi:hypothetical protein